MEVRKKSYMKNNIFKKLLQCEIKFQYDRGERKIKSCPAITYKLGRDLKGDGRTRRGDLGVCFSSKTEPTNHGKRSELMNDSDIGTPSYWK